MPRLFSLPLISYKNRLPRRGTGGGEKRLHKITQDLTAVHNFTQPFTSLPSPSQGIPLFEYILSPSPDGSAPVKQDVLLYIQKSPGGRGILPGGSSAALHNVLIGPTVVRCEANR